MNDLTAHSPLTAAPTSGTAVDPVCGMTVDPEDARDRGLHVRHEDVDVVDEGAADVGQVLHSAAPILTCGLPGR